MVVEKITIQKSNNLLFIVSVEGGGSKTNHKVYVDSGYPESLGWFDTEAFVKKSFEFLLERESKEAILEEFNISLIGKYFTEYEEEIGTQNDI